MVNFSFEWSEYKRTSSEPLRHKGQEAKRGIAILKITLLTDFVTFFLFPNFDVSVNMYTGYGELLLCLWLLVKGVNVKGWEQRALESAHKSPMPAG